jgi:hypothetical protein
MMPFPNDDTMFKPGQSGNPKGKPKGIPHSRTRLRRLLELSQDLKNPVTGEVEGFTVMEQIDMKLIQKARNGDLGAMKELLDRLEGKPNQGVDITSGGHPLPILGGIAKKRIEDVQPDNGHPEDS